MDSPPPSPTERAARDREILTRLQAGDEAALSDLYDRFAGTLNAIALRVLGDSSDAEEVVQEAFLHAWNRAGTYDPRRSSVSTWLVLVTRSRAIDRLRTRQVVDRTHDQVRHQAPLHESPKASAHVQEGDRRRRIAAALAALPEEQRQVIGMAYYGGKTQREIAEETGIPLGTVKTRTLLALKKLRAELLEELGELL